MRIGEYRVWEHVRLLAPILAVLAGAWALRWILAASGAPPWLVRVVSLTAATPIAIVVGVVLVHARRFGGYASVVLVALLLNAWAEGLICVAILISVATGIDNVYTFPEFSMPGDDPRHLRHIYGHLTFGVGIGSLIGAAVGSLILFLLRRLVPLPERSTADRGPLD
jgi:hypothetical protein